MKNFTLFQAAAACGGQLLGETNKDRELGHVVIDSRKVEPGDLFVAYKGEKTDGHAYVTVALDKGAAACLVEHPVEGETRTLLLVPDVQKALEQIAAAYRKTLSLPVILLSEDSVTRAGSSPTAPIAPIWSLPSSLTSASRFSRPREISTTRSASP